MSEVKTRKKKKRRFTLFYTLAILALLGAAAFAIVKIAPRFTYPKKYTDQVEKYSRANGLDENLVYAVIRTESGFKKDAVSRSGALGLMQLMPDTAEWIAWKRGVEYEREKLFDPDYNIDFGCWLLAYLIDYYGGNLEHAIAAYNAGPGNVDSWLKDHEHYDGNELKIPFRETENYVKKTLNAYEKYKYTK